METRLDRQSLLLDTFGMGFFLSPCTPNCYDSRCHISIIGHFHYCNIEYRGSCTCICTCTCTCTPIIVHIIVYYGCNILWYTYMYMYMYMYVNEIESVHLFICAVDNVETDRQRVPHLWLR